MKKFLLIVAVLALSGPGARASQVVRDSIHSANLGLTLPYVVILPDSYAVQSQRGVRFPVLYLLHCAGCIHDTWLEASMGNVGAFIDTMHYIIACPSDGSSLFYSRYFSWWLDSPVIDSGYAVSRYFAEEFKPRIDSLYATLPDRAHAGLAGFSMGGFGATHNIIRHPDLFSAAFSIKGGVDLIPFAGSFSLDDVLGDQQTHMANWRAVNIVDNICSLKDSNVTIGFYTGEMDFFRDGNLQLDTVMHDCGMADTFWVTNEGHGSVPDLQMERIMEWFDDVFAGTASVNRPQHRPASQTGVRSDARAGGAVLRVDILGRGLTRGARLPARQGPGLVLLVDPRNGRVTASVVSPGL